MQKLKVVMPARKLIFPTYCSPEKKTQPKSCFIDSNRIDTVKVAKVTKSIPKTD